MRIDEILAARGPVFSFEFFPPKTEAGERNLYAALSDLRPLEPSFVSVTYGAGGSTRSKTIEIVKRIRDEYGLEAMAHFTCVGATVSELRATLDEMRQAGIDNVLALRGDPPAGQEEWTKTEGGLEYSRELVELMAAMCGSAIPAALRRELHARGDDTEAVLDFGVAYATLQCAELLAAGAPGIHFYTLNRSPATRAILSALKLTRPWEKAVYPASISSASATRGEPSAAS